jgi:gliding motility-associated-like protein
MLQATNQNLDISPLMNNLMHLNQLKKYVLSLALSLIVYSSYPQSFSAVTNELPALKNSSAATADFNMDGYLDVLLSGLDENNLVSLNIYLGNGTGSFAPVTSHLPKIYSADFCVYDFNADGFPDVILTGKTALGNYITQLYINNGNNTFSLSAENFENIKNGTITLADVDRNGYVDVVQSGFNSSLERKLFVYVNNKGTFKKELVDIPGITDGCLETEDINKDGWPDIVYSGITDYGKCTGIFLNKGDFNFDELPINLPAISHGDLCIFDIDSDADLDIVLSGIDITNDLIGEIYLNDGDLNFSPSTTTFPNLNYSSISYGDLSNDGHNDIVICGQLSSGLAYTGIFVNNNDGSFSLQTDELPGVRYGTITLFDIEKDGDIDILSTGLGNTEPFTILFKNHGLPIKNENPSIPSNLVQIITKDHVTITWDSSMDSKTPANTIKYNIALGTSSGNYDIQPEVPPGCHGSSAVIQTAYSALSTHSLFVLPEGVYYWKAQSIDNGFAISGYSVEQSLTICYPFILGNDTSMCAGDTLKMETPKSGFSYKWSFNGIVISQDEGIEHVITIPGELILEVERFPGVSTSDTIMINVSSPPELSLGPDTAICPGATLTIYNKAYPEMKMDWYDINDSPLLADATSYDFHDESFNGVIAKAVNETGCHSTDTMYVSVLKPTEPSLPRDTAVCTNQNVQLEVDDAFIQPSWKLYQNEIEDGNGILYVAKYQDTIIFSGISPENCEVTDSIFIYTFPLPDINLRNDTSLCKHEKLSLAIETNHPDDSISWNSVSETFFLNGDSLIYHVTKSDTVLGHITNNHGCAVTDSIFITCHPLPKVNIISNHMVCEGNPLEINANSTSSTDNLVWLNTNNQIISEDTFFTINPKHNDTLFVVVTSAHDCISADTAVVNIKPYIPLFQSKDTTACTGETIDVPYYSGRDIIHCSFTSTNASLVLDTTTSEVAVPGVNNQLVGSYITKDGCTFSDTLTVSVFEQPKMELGKDVSLCMHDSAWFKPQHRTIPSQLTWTYGAFRHLPGDSAFIPVDNDMQVTCMLTDSNGCQIVDSMHIQALQPPAINLPKMVKLCPHDSINLVVAGDSVRWLFDTRIRTGSSFMDVFVNNDSVRVIVTDSMHCSNTQQIYLKQLPKPEISFFKDTVVCKHEFFELSYPVKTSETAIWMTRKDQTYPNPLQHSIGTAEQFTLSVTNDYGCNTTETVNITPHSPPTVQLADTIRACVQQQVRVEEHVFVDHAAPGWTYRWQPAALVVGGRGLDALLRPARDTAIRLVVANGICKADTLFSFVELIPAPTIVMSGDTAIGHNGRVLLDVETTDNCSVHWYPGHFLSSTTIRDPVAYPPVTTTFYAQVKDEHGCTSKDSVTVFVKNEVFVPTLFSPNGDGHNDAFQVYGAGIEHLEVHIYSLSGELMWESASVSGICFTGWDGRRHGAPVPEGTYIWKINGRYSHGEPVLFNGTDTGMVQLIR